MYFARKFKIPRIESEKHVFELGQKKSYQISGEACTELPGERELFLASEPEDHAIITLPPMVLQC